MPTAADIVPPPPPSSPPPPPATAATSFIVPCGSCGTSLGAEVLNTAMPVPCARCGAQLQTQVFPALFRPAESGRAGEDLGSGGGVGIDAEAACFFHPGKRAVVPCSGCGRFLCHLCDLDLNGDGRHLCPECLRGGQAAGRLPELESGRMFHDRLALMLSVLPLLLWPFTLVTAPAALFLVVRYWHEPTLGPAPRSRAALVFAGLFAAAQLLGWAAGGYFLLRRHL